MNLFGRLRFIFYGLALLSFAILYLPIIYIISSSLCTSDGLCSTASYAKALANDVLIEALAYSAVIALVSSVVSCCLGLLAALGLQGAQSFWTLKLRALLYLPMMLPEIVIGISLLLWFVLLKIALGQFSLIIAHVAFTFSYAVIITTLGLENIDKFIFEAAKDLGATLWTTHKKITLPLLKPSILGSFFLCFVISFDDFLISYFTAGVGNDTLPMKLYTLMRFGVTPELKAISVLVLMVSFMTTFLLLGTFRKLMPRSKAIAN